MHASASIHFRHCKGLYVSAIKKSFKYGDHTVTIETGELARQADGAVLVTMSDTVVLVTAVGLKKATPGRDFFPLTVNTIADVIEPGYALGERLIRAAKVAVSVPE